MKELVIALIIVFVAWSIGFWIAAISDMKEHGEWDKKENKE